MKNTVLRYGKNISAGKDDSLYNSWLEAKEKVVKSKKCMWTEIVSIHLLSDDNQVVKMNQLGRTGPNYYQSYRIDDIVHPMLQMTIFEYSNGEKEALIGWEFPMVFNRSAFLVRNIAIVDYLVNYFNVCANWSEQPVP